MSVTLKAYTISSVFSIEGNMQINNVSGTLTYGQGDHSFQTAGGIEGIRQLVTDFYQQMDSLPQASHIRSLHPVDQEESIDKLARFLTGWMGGPALYEEKYGRISIPGAHHHIDIGIAERDAWLLCMQNALALQADYPEDFRRYLMKQLSFPANLCRNRD